MRIVCKILFSVLLLRCSGALAQAFDDEPYYPFAPYEEERIPGIGERFAAFYRAVQQADDLWAEVSAFRFSAVSYRRRGEDYALSPVLLEGAEVSWRYLTALRRLQAETRYVAGARPQVGRLSVGAGATAVSLTEYDPVPGGALALRAATRNYRAGAEGSLAFELPRRWHLAVTVDGRFGRDALVDGVYTRQTTAALRVGRRTRGDGYWTAVFVVPFAERGLRSSSVEEAFMLRVPLTTIPHGVVRRAMCVTAGCGARGCRWYRRLLRPDRRVDAVAGIRRGRDGHTVPEPAGLVRRFDAPSRQLPITCPVTSRARRSEAVDAVWRAGDERHTQIDWAELYRRNRMQPDGEALLCLEDRVERPLRMQTAIRIESEVDPQLTVACALRVDYDAPRRYKQLRDLLGADRLTDIDRFLLDDATYPTVCRTTCATPDRTVGEGDRFGYDYRTVRCEVAADGGALPFDRWTAAFGAARGRCVVRRRGFYEKELFPGAGSLRRFFAVAVHTLRVAGQRRLCLFIAQLSRNLASASAAVPDVEDMFCSRSTTTGRWMIRPVAPLRRRTGFRPHGRGLRAAVTGYLAATRDEIRTTRFFDDLSYEYCDMTVRGIGRLDYGAEAAARLRLYVELSLSAAVGAGSHTLCDESSAWLLHRCGQRAPADGVTSCHYERSSARRHCSLAATAGVHYFGRSGWYFSADASLVAGRWVAPSFHYRTSRVANQASDSPRNIRSFHGAGAAGRLLYGRCLGGENVAAGRVETVGHAVGTQPARRPSHGLFRLRVRSGAAPAQRCRDLYRPFATSLLYA